MKFKFELYQRRFRQPLRTSHGVWQIREGIIISLSDRAGKFALGEIAPLPWFGSETMSEALEFCQQCGETINIEDIIQIPDSLPACQFAVESAWLDLSETKKSDRPTDLDYCYLLPGGEQALTTWQEIYRHQGNTTFKWKIGVYSLDREIEILKQLVATLPPKVKLRLDANGGLNLSGAKKLLTVTDKLEAIDFIEQPLPPDNFAEMLKLSQDYRTSIALDESVASFRQLEQAHQQGWQEVFIIKAAIMGFPSRLLKYCRQHSLDVVFSSVFETEVGRSAVLKLAKQLDRPRAVGFGVNYFI